MEVLFRGSRDGFSLKNYSKNLQGKKNLIHIVRTEAGKGLGGFHSDEKKFDSSFARDEEAFLFSLDRREKYSQ